MPSDKLLTVGTRVSVTFWGAIYEAQVIRHTVPGIVHCVFEGTTRPRVFHRESLNVIGESAQ